MADEKPNDVLRRARPWSSHPPDEEDARVLKLGETDPALALVRRENEKFNARVHDQLAGIPVPEQLRDQILARRKIIRWARWTHPKRLLPLAAALALMATGLFLATRPREDISIAGFSSRMVGFAVREYRMDVFTKDLPDLKSYLQAQQSPAQFTLPPGLAATPLKGGAALTWQGNKVSMVCFDWQGADTLYMFILEKPMTASPEIQKVKGLTTATWTADGKTFLVAGRIPEETLAGLVKS